MMTKALFSGCGPVAAAALLLTVSHILPVSAESPENLPKDAPASAAAATPEAALSKAQAELDTAWRALEPLGFSAGLFVEAGSVVGYGAYVPRAKASFAPTDTLVVYAQPVGYGYRETETGYGIRLTADYTLLTPSGQVLAEEKGFARLTSDSREKRRELYITLRLGFDGLRPGAYTLLARINDAVSGKSGELSLPFTVTAE
ncbi:hypothetical protein GCM10007285_18870 [Stappia taiwanensis]|nr:hypothetical protein GCM10007285_18870 [Stappia taiwanensis]